MSVDFDRIVDKANGRVYLPEPNCSFEAIEKMYEYIKPFLEHRRELGVPEGANEFKKPGGDKVIP